MELKPAVTAFLFAILLAVFLLTEGKEENNNTVQDVWQGRITTVTASGAMVETTSGTFWVSDTNLCCNAIRGDSILILGRGRGRFLTALSIRIKHSNSLCSKARRGFRNILAARIDDLEARGLTGGLLMGLRGIIPSETAMAFRNTGTSHLLALSGLHTVIVAFILTVAAGAVFGKRPASFITAAAGVVIFVLLSGGRASTVRAGIMSVSALLWMCCRGGKLHGLSLWWLALVISICISPGILQDRGAQMSFGAVLSLLLFGRTFHGKLAFLLSPLHAGITVTAGLMPLITGVYGGIVLTGPLATVLSLPFMISVMVLGGLAAAGVSVVLPLLQWTAGAWTGMLKGLAASSVALPGNVLWPLWVFSLLTLRVTSKWNGFHRRFR